MELWMGFHYILNPPRTCNNISKSLMESDVALCLRNRSAPAVNCWVIIHCLEVSCKEDQIMSAQREWFIFVQLTDKQWIITQQFTHWSWSISILTHNKRRKYIRSLQLFPTFRHCIEELPSILRLRRIRLHVIVTSFKRKNDVTPSNAMNDVIFEWRQLSHTLAVNYCPIYHSLLPLALQARCVRISNNTMFKANLSLSCGMRFPTMQHFDKCRLRRASAAPSKLTNSKWCSVSSLTSIEYSSD